MHLKASVLLLFVICQKTLPDNNTSVEDDLKEAIAKLRRALKGVELTKLKDDQLTNKACIESIADTCTDAKYKFTCDNTECISPESSIKSCTNNDDVIDAESTHNAIKQIFYLCQEPKEVPKKIRPVSPSELPAKLRDPITKLKKALKSVSLSRLDVRLLTNKACVDAIADACTDAAQKFGCNNTECISPKSPPIACRNSDKVEDAYLTYKTIKAVIEPCVDSQKPTTKPPPTTKKLPDTDIESYKEVDDSIAKPSKP